VGLLEEGEPDVGDDAGAFEVGEDMGLSGFDAVGAVLVVLSIVHVVLDPDVGASAHAAAGLPLGEGLKALAGGGR
jgi:hypothetical protein